MVRAMYSGVAGMKIEQTRMDVIGNNIANVSTYGYKSGRATFRDVYYQTNSGATTPTGAIGGRNAMQVGVGAKMGSIDINHSQSVMTTTGYGLDVAIAGEGYLQVQDRNGNIFYTKAGMLDIDAGGNLVDVNGNFVLGVSGDPYNQGPGSSRITIKLPNAPAAAATVTELVNKKNITLTSSEKSELANVSINFETSNSLPLNTRAKATVDSGSILIQLNENEMFTSSAETIDPITGATIPAKTWLDDFNEAVNDAIKEAYGGNSPLGDVAIEIDDPTALAKFQYKASDIVDYSYKYVNGGIATIDPETQTAVFNKDSKLPGAWDLAGFSIANTGSEFGTNWSVSSEDEHLNVKIADFKMSVKEIDANDDGQYNGAKDALAFIYEVTDADGNNFVYGAVSARESLVSENSLVLKLLSTAEVESLNSKRDPSVGDEIEAPTNDIIPTETDSITLKMPPLSKMQSVVTAIGVVDWEKYTVSSTDTPPVAVADIAKAKSDAIALQKAATDLAKLFSTHSSGGEIADPTAITDAADAALTAAQDTTTDAAYTAADDRYQDLLSAFGVDQDGAVDPTLFEDDTALPTDAAGVAYTLAQAQVAFDAAKATYDTNNNRVQANITAAQAVVDALADADTDGDGTLSRTEISQANTKAKLAADTADAYAKAVAAGTPKIVASDGVRALGFGSTAFSLTGGTEGGPQDASDLTSLSINDRGVLSGDHASLGHLEFGRIDLATFENPQGLTQVGNTYFAVSGNSGNAKIVMAGSDGTGAIAASTLETSNVDLSNEFSDMIVTQRSFQANSRIITVSDSMIEELVNLKR